MRTARLALALVVATASIAAADTRLGALRLSAPEQPNRGPARLGVSNLRFVVVNSARAPVPLEGLRVRFRSRRVMDQSWTTETVRVPGALWIEGGPDDGSRVVAVPPGRHVLVVRFDRVPASAYQVHTAGVSLRSRGITRVLQLAVTTSRRHPRRR